MGKTDLMDTKTLFQRARQLRKEKKMTQGELAELMGVSQSAISQAERDASERMNALRVQIVEKLTGRKVGGPYWVFEDKQK